MRYIGIDCDSKQISAVVLNSQGKWEKSFFIYDKDLKDYGERFYFLVDTFERIVGMDINLSSHFQKMIIEDSIYIQNAKATINISKVIGYLQGTAIRWRLPLTVVDNKVWKKDVIGKGNINKEDIMKFAVDKWGKDVIINEHIADAACIALYGVLNNEKSDKC